VGATHVQLRDETVLVLHAVRAEAGYITSTLLGLRAFTRPAVGGLNRELRLHFMQGHFVVILHVLRRSQQPSKHSVPYPCSTCCTVPRTRTHSHTALVLIFALVLILVLILVLVLVLYPPVCWRTPRCTPQCSYESGTWTHILWDPVVLRPPGGINDYLTGSQSGDATLRRRRLDELPPSVCILGTERLGGVVE
jgi:hypothetical protein